VPRPRSDERRAAILDAATRVIAAQGLGAATATIAKQAGVSNGTVFVYFETKATLVNALYVGLKTEMVTTAVDGVSPRAESRDQLRHLWDRWLGWATTYPAKRRTLAQLDVSEDITADSHKTVRNATTGIAQVLERCRAGGPTRDAPRSFVLALTSVIADATIDAMIRDPAAADVYRTVGFEATWRVLAGAPVSTTT